MFARLSDRLQGIVHKLRNKGKVSPQDVREVMREVRMALLEADVNFTLVKDFIARVTERAEGHEVLSGLQPGQQVIQVVLEELTVLMGEEGAGLVAGARPRKLLLLGLQGAGKTTTAGKLARYLQKQDRKVLLVAADVHRPAAIQQLQVLAKQLEVDCIIPEGTEGAVSVAQRGAAYAAEHGCDDVIVDTAGRLHIDAAMMEELKEVSQAVAPQEALLVVDAMTGQDAVTVAQQFHDEIGVTGIILTKLDGDARGGAALSVRAVTGCAIKFVGTGEKLEALEPFFPERMASRILGMGDVVTLIEKAQAVAEQGEKNPLSTDNFSLDDLLVQIEQVQKMGPMEDILSLMPGGSSLRSLTQAADGGEAMGRIKAIVRSMTLAERAKPEIINGSRRRRIALGSGTTVTEVNRLLKMFTQLRTFLRSMHQAGGKKRGGIRSLLGGFSPGNFKRR